MLGAEPRETSVGGPRRADSWGLGAPGKHVDGTCRLAADGPPLTGQWQLLLEQTVSAFAPETWARCLPSLVLVGALLLGLKWRFAKKICRRL